MIKKLTKQNKADFIWKVIVVFVVVKSLDLLEGKKPVDCQSCY